MNARGSLKRILALVMAIAICFSIVPWSVLAADSATYTRISSMDDLTSGSYVLIASNGYAPCVLDGSWVTAVDFTAHTGDTVADAQGAVWTVTVSGGTAVLTDGNGKSIAPKAGNTNGIQEGSYSWAVTCEDGMFTFAGQGADTTVLAGNASSGGKFRAYKTATVSNSPSGYPSTFALYKLDETAGEEPSEEPTEETTEASTEETTEPAFTVPTVPEETGSVTWKKVELANITEEDVIAITMTKGDTTWVLPNVAEGSKGQPLASYTGTIDGDKLTTDVEALYSWTVSATEGGYYIKNGEQYLSVTATNNGVRIDNTAAVWNIVEGYLASPDSKGATRFLGVYNSTDWRCYTNTTGNTAGQELGLWKLKTEEEEPEVPEVPDVPEVPTGIADGDYVIWAPAYNMALSSVYNGFYNTGVTVTLDGDKLSGYGTTEIWTVKNNEDGTVTISCADGKLSMDTSYTSMPLNKVNDTWTLEDAGNGLWYVKNVGRGTYIEWYEKNSNWSGYYNIAEGSEGMFALRFTPVEAEEPEVPDVPEVPTGIADGDYVIWAPAYNMALSSVYNGFYNTGVTVTLDGDKLSGYGTTEIWTVKNNEDGTVTISCADGKLSMDTSYTSMPLNKVNDTWTLEDAGNGLWYVKNVGRGTYIEWYEKNSNWSGYYNIAEGSEGMFALRFTPVEAEEPEVPDVPEVPTGIADGDYVIWAPAYNMALSSVYNGFYNTGVTVTLDGDKLSGYGTTEIWTVKNNEDGTVTISCADGKLSMDTSYTSMPLNKVNDTWTLEDAGNGLWYVKNVGRGTYIEWYEKNSNWSGYYNIAEGSEGMFALCFTPAEVAEEPAGIADGDYVIWAPAYNVTVANAFNGSNYQLGTPVTPVGDDLVGYGAIDIWTVTNNEDGTVSISQDGKFLGGTSGTLTIVGAEGDYAKWKLTFLENGDCYLQNVGNSKYLEWYATYSDWTLYSFNEANADLYTLRFTPAELVYDTDSEVVNNIAQWSGAYTEEAAAQLEAYGDKYISGDKLDAEAILTVVANGTQISPYYLPGPSPSGPPAAISCTLASSTPIPIFPTAPVPLRRPSPMPTMPTTWTSWQLPTTPIPSTMQMPVSSARMAPPSVRSGPWATRWHRSTLMIPSSACMATK